jgi:hypothetical protein
VRRDLLLLHRPTDKLSSPVSHVGGKTLRLQIEAGLRSVDHGSSRSGLTVGPSRRRSVAERSQKQHPNFDMNVELILAHFLTGRLRATSWGVP